MWTPDLNGRNQTRYLAIVEALADSIAAGELRPGERLPTYRELAWQLRVNVSTVTQAYREAARQHLVSGEVGRGTYVLSGSREAAQGSPHSQTAPNISRKTGCAASRWANCRISGCRRWSGMVGMSS